MIVLITPPVPFNTERTEAPDRAPHSHSNILHYCWGRRLWKIGDIPFYYLVGTSGKSMAFFFEILFFFFFFKDFYETVSIQLELKEGKPRPETCWGTKKRKQKQNETGRDWSPAGTVGLKSPGGESTTGRWCWPCLRETDGTGGRWRRPPGRRTWWAARTASSGSCSVLEDEKKTDVGV